MYGMTGLLNDNSFFLAFWDKYTIKFTSDVSLVGLLLLLDKAASLLLEEMEVCLSQKSEYKFV